MTSVQFKFGDRIVHTGKPEWGVGVVSAAMPATQDGKPCQRLTVRFDRAGIKTLSTALATLQPADEHPEIEKAIVQSKGDWLGEVGSKQVQEIMTRLPDAATDPFSSIESRLKATLALFRYQPTGGSIMDWASVQSGLKDPMNRFSRHDIEEFYKRFVFNRDQHLKRLLGEVPKTEPLLVGRALEGAPPGARDAVRRVDGQR